MTQLTAAKLALAVAGVLIWAYGIRTAQEPLKYFGIGLLVVSVILRFIGKRSGAR